MFLFYPIHFLKFGGKSPPQRSYENGSYKEKECIQIKATEQYFPVMLFIS